MVHVLGGSLLAATKKYDPGFREVNHKAASLGSGGQHTVEGLEHFHEGIP